MISSKLVCQHHKREREETWLKKSSLERKWEESRHESPQPRHIYILIPPHPPSSDEKSIFLSDLSMWLWSIFFPMVSLFLSWNPLRGVYMYKQNEKHPPQHADSHTYWKCFIYPLKYWHMAKKKRWIGYKKKKDRPNIPYI